MHQSVLSPTTISNSGICIDELKSLFKKLIQDNDVYLLHNMLTSLLLFVDDLILLASLSEGIETN
jgi:hypothetical protein